VSIREPGNSRPGEAWPERVLVEGHRVRTAFRVRYAETDQMGMAYYAGYLVWFEVLRGDLMRAADIPYTALEAEGYYLPIVEAHLRYLKPARYDDPVEVVGWIRELRSRRVGFEYRVERGSELLAEGWTVHIPMGRDGRPRAFSRELLTRLGDWIHDT
jgi:acyl-CoA thioester hydrolase